MALQVDIGDPAQCSAFVGQAAEKMGGLDALINNAAITGLKAASFLSDVTAEQFRRLLDVNLGGPVFCSQAAVPYLRRAGGGTIIHISSTNAFRPQRGALLYAASKAALTSLTQSMARELASDGIRVVAVAPGDIRVDTSADLLAQGSSMRLGADIVDQTPLGAGKPEDIAEVVNFLISPRAKFVTGVTWVVDGGLLA
jgi:NAD(P)-dependent dehydrogenase (short-subunit alcohol dehydrogenase family)